MQYHIQSEDCYTSQVNSPKLSGSMRVSLEQTLFCMKLFEPRLLRQQGVCFEITNNMHRHNIFLDYQCLYSKEFESFSDILQWVERVLLAEHQLQIVRDCKLKFCTIYWKRQIILNLIFVWPICLTLCAVSSKSSGFNYVGSMKCSFVDSTIRSSTSNSASETQNSALSSSIAISTGYNGPTLASQTASEKKSLSTGINHCHTCTLARIIFTYFYIFAISYLICVCLAALLFLCRSSLLFQHFQMESRHQVS